MVERYWDLSDRQRAELSAEQFEALLAVERMEKGVATPPEPEYVDETVAPVPTTRAFGIRFKTEAYREETADLLFPSAEAAAQAAALVTRVKGYDYSASSSGNVIKIPSDVSIVPVDLPTAEALAAARPEQQKAAIARERNKTMRDEYTKAMSAYADAANDVRSDRVRCQTLARTHRGVIATFEEFTRTAQGDADMAGRFLRKAHTQEAIEAAFAWFERPLPESLQPSARAPAPT